MANLGNVFNVDAKLEKENMLALPAVLYVLTNNRLMAPSIGLLVLNCHYLRLNQTFIVILMHIYNKMKLDGSP